MKFGILQECAVSGRKHWVQPNGITAASGRENGGLGRPFSLAYDHRADAERDIEKCRADNARMVEQTKRSRKFKTHPATYRIVEVD